MRLGVLTGGGDVPGLNAAIKSVYESARDRGWVRPGSADGDVVGILRGWQGAVRMGPDAACEEGPCTIELTDRLVRTVDRYGGTFLHSSRTRPDRMRLKELTPAQQRSPGTLARAEGHDDRYDLTDQLIANLQGRGIDCLVAIGGDDTLGYGHALARRNVPVVAIPKTMDNDVRGTEYAIGYMTALTRADDFINRQRTHLGSHETVGVFRIFGRNAGFTALGTAMAISDIRCAIPEHRFDLETLCRLVRQDYEGNEQRYAMVLCSEGAMWQGGQIEEYGPPDAYGHRKKSNVAEALAQEISRSTGLPTRMQDITYDLRSGSPDVVDKIVANTYGALAVELIASGRTGRMVCMRDGTFTHTELPDPARGARTVDVATLYDTERLRPRFPGLFERPLFF